MDKQKERNLLGLIYNDSEYAEIVDSEEPDFNIRHKNSTYRFGVEVTEFYYTESNARLRNIINYFTELTENEKYRHKKDKRDLEVREFTIISDQGVDKGKAKGILQELPTIDKYVDMITERICSKEAKLSGYDKTLAHVNLIIFAAEQRIATVPIREYYRHLYTETLKDTLHRTSFREIFLITTIHENRRVYIPLKMILLVADLYMFRQLLLDYFPQKAEVSLNDFMILFAKFMRYKTRNALYRVKQGRVEVVWGNSSVSLGEKSNSIMDYGDQPLPPDTIKPNLQGIIRFFTSSTFKTNFRNLYEKGTFSTKLAFDVKAKVKL
jgi:hypothetical protein